MKRSRWAVLFPIMSAMLALLWVGCGGDAFGISDEPSGDAMPDNQVDVSPEADAGRDAKPEADAHHEAEAAVPEAGHDAKPDADAGWDAEAEAEASVEPQPEASVDAAEEPEVSIPDAAEEPEAAVDAPLDSPQDTSHEPDVVQPDVVTDVAIDGPVLTPCQKWGTLGKITVIIETAANPPVGKVLGVFGQVTYFDPDAGASTGLTTWKLNLPVPLPPDALNRLVVAPSPVATNMELLFEPGYALPGDTNFDHWQKLCDSATCPVADSYQVCQGLNPLGDWSNGHFHGSCEPKLSGNMSFNYIRCWL